MLVKVSEVLVVHPSLGVKTVPELVALAKARPQQITYGSAGNGHPTHLMMELFQRQAGITLVHVPYKGTSPAMQALASGEVAAYNIGIGLVRPHITGGRVRALARTGYPSKDALPEVPPLTRFYPDAEYIPWQAAFAPKGTPREVIARLNGAIAKALAAPEVTTPAYRARSHRRRQLAGRARSVGALGNEREPGPGEEHRTETGLTCGRRAMAKPLKKTRVELNNAVFSLPDIVAQAEGYFEQEGLDVELVLPEKRKAMLAQRERARASTPPYSPFCGTRA